MKGVRVDPVARTALVAGGATLGDVDHATHAFGLVTPFGIQSTTGVAGLTLGGGLGHLTRAFGLSIDSLLAVDVVLADGSFVTASAAEHADLFWAVRGGGGNFGVVTAFLFRLHPLSTVVGGPMLWDMDRAAEVMRWYRDCIVQAPDQINGFFAFMKVPPGPPFPEELHTRTMCGIMWCYTGAEDESGSIFDPIRRVAGGPVLDMVGPMPHLVLQSMFDPLVPAGLQWYWRADFVDQLSDDAIALHVRYGLELPTLLSQMQLLHILQAEGKAQVQPDRVADDLRWETVAAVQRGSGDGRTHLARLPGLPT